MAENRVADPSRTLQFRVFALEAAAGVMAIAAASFYRGYEIPLIFRALGSDAVPILIACLLFALSTALLKFELTNRLFVSMVIISYIVIFPLLGTVLSAWIAVVVSIVSRGRLIRDSLLTGGAAARLELVNTFRLFATYGIPIIAASLCYSFLGGEVPLRSVTALNTYRIVFSALLLVLTNALLMIPIMIAYGYGRSTRLRLIYSDSSIYLLAFPYALMTIFAYVRIGLGAFISLGFSGVLINYVARKLASARSETRQQLQRVASLSNIGKTISLNFTTEQLLMTIYTECKKVVDVSLFAIALLDENTQELSFEIDIQNDRRVPKSRIPLGEGLNSWVVENQEPLLIGSFRDESRLGIVAVDDGLTTESWLGVPMVARDRVIGVISIQSSRKSVFTNDDMVLLTSIANQAAVALENATLYKDLEGLTLALESRVQERTSELRETNLRLMAADRSKNQFLANMSHELRTPLNSIIGFSSVLVEGTRELLPGKPHIFLQNIYSAGTHLLELISDILDLSKIDAGKMELRPEVFDIRNTIASVERVMRSYASESSTRVVVDIGSDVPPLRLDEGRLKQILFNLLSNAIKFSPNGGTITITVSQVAAAQSPIGTDSVRIEVADEGMGMEQEELRKIFDEFYQTEEGRRTTRSGTGLGLSLARNFVELHHGIIDVRSSPGVGSTFTLHLPIDFQEVQTEFAFPPSGSGPRFGAPPTSA